MIKKMLNCRDTENMDLTLEKFSPEEQEKLKERGIIGIRARRFNKKAVSRKVDYLVNEFLEIR